MLGVHVYTNTTKWCAFCKQLAILTRPYLFTVLYMGDEILSNHGHYKLHSTHNQSDINNGLTRNTFNK